MPEFEDLFEVEKDTEHGRIGEITLNSKKIQTPINIPTIKEKN